MCAKQMVVCERLGFCVSGFVSHCVRPRVCVCDGGWKRVDLFKSVTTAIR